MDPSLFKAARDGSIEMMLKLLEDDPLILERAATSSADTPLHIAAMLGHLDLVKLLIERKTNSNAYVKELNHHGFGSIHLASANGHVDVVRVLLDANTEVCSLKGTDGMTPLHCASVKGRAEIIALLLEHYSDVAVSDVTVRGETALHLVVKNNQIGALQTLVEELKQRKLSNILNAQDKEGNSVLHLAAARRNHQALELLLNCNNLCPGVLQINATNANGLTALDIVQICHCDYSNEDIERLLKQAGAEKARDLINISPNRINSQDQVPNRPESPALTARPQSREEILNWEDYFKFQFDKSNPENVRADLLVVTVLMATATYQAGLSPPGGLKNDGTREGEALLAASNPFSFVWFMFFNSAGFFMSLSIIVVLTSNHPMFWDLNVAIAAMVATYDAGMISISPPGGIRSFFTALSIFMPISIPIVQYQIRKWSKRSRARQLAYRRSNERV